MAKNIISPPSSSPTLAALLKSSRENKGWSQTELARQSRVSTRTIVDIETEKQKKPRVDVVVRLARSFDQEPNSWLQIAGHMNVASAKVEKITRESGGFQFEGEIDPAGFFASLESHLQPKQPVLMCIAYPSVPGSIHRLDVQRTLVGLFNKGLWVAMVCPFPKITNIETGKNPVLSRHYRDVYGNVVALARELRSKLSPEKRKQLAVFVPRQDDKPHFVMPMMGLSESRAALIQYFPKEESEESQFELSAWVTILQDRKDRWIKVYSSLTEQEGGAHLQTFLCWRDYFSDILNNCDPKKGKGWKSEDLKGADWELVDLGSIS